MTEGLKHRIEAWLAASNCNCDGEVYCSFCEILMDVLDEEDAKEETGNESEEANHVEFDSVADRPGEVCAGGVQTEADAGGRSGAVES